MSQFVHPPMLANWLHLTKSHTARISISFWSKSSSANIVLILRRRRDRCAHYTHFLPIYHNWNQRRVKSIGGKCAVGRKRQEEEFIWIATFFVVSTNYWQIAGRRCAPRLLRRRLSRFTHEFVILRRRLEDLDKSVLTIHVLLHLKT